MPQFRLRGRPNTINVSILPNKLINSEQLHIIKASVFKWIEQPGNKAHLEDHAQNNSEIKTVHGARVNKIMWYWHRNNQIG